MVGKRSWPMVEILWILEKWRDGCKIHNLVDQYVKEFPNSHRNHDLKTLRTGIQYVWDKYNKDPSYNCDFSEDEIWFIMVTSHRVKGGIITEVLKRFKENFPHHDWKTYVDELLAIEATIAKYQRTPPYCIKWQHDEIRFIIINKSKTESWDELLNAFQAWRRREEVTISSLQYLYASRQLENYRETNELEDLDRNVPPHHNDDSLAIGQNSTKRMLETRSSMEESQSKRLRMCSQQQPGESDRSKLRALDVNNVSASNRNSNKMSNSKFLERFHPGIPLRDSPVNPGVRFPMPSMQRHNGIGGRHRYLNQPVSIPNLNNPTPTMPLSQRIPSGSLQHGAMDPRHPSLAIIPQQIRYDGRDRPRFFMPVQAAPVGNEQFPRGQYRSRALSRGAVSQPSTAPDWSPRDPWNQNTFQSINHHTNSSSAHAGPVTCNNWQQPQFSLPNNLWGLPGMEGNQLRFSHVEAPFMNAGLNLFGNMQQASSALPAPSSMLVAEGNQMHFRDTSVLHVQGDSVGVRNLQEPGPAIACDLSRMQGTREIQAYHPDRGALIWQADAHSYENWLAPISIIPDVAFDLRGSVQAQQSHIDSHALVGQWEFHPHRNLISTTPKISHDIPGTFGAEGNQVHLPELTVMSTQPTFISNEIRPDPASVVSTDLSSTLGMENYQNFLFADSNTRQMQDMYLPNKSLQQQDFRMVEPENLLTLPKMENSQVGRNPGPLSGNIVSPADTLRRMAVATEEVGCEEFLSSDPANLTRSYDFLSSELDAHGNPSRVVGMGGDKYVLSEQQNFSTIGALQPSETTNGIDFQFSIPGMTQNQVPPDDQAISPEQPVVTEKDDDNVLLPKAEDVDFDMLSLFEPAYIGWIEPDLDVLSEFGIILPACEIPEVVTETGVVETRVPLENILQQPLGGNDVSNRDVHEDV